MNLAISSTSLQQPPMQVVKGEERMFQTRYLKGLNLVTVKGWSLTNDIYKKYTQLLKDVKKHFESSNTLNIHFKYELFNSSTLRYLFRIIKLLNEAHTQGKVVKIYWSCDSQNGNEMIDMGLDLANLSDFRFQISYL